MLCIKLFMVLQNIWILADYYHMAIEDAIFYLKNYVTSNEEKDIDQTKK